MEAFRYRYHPVAHRMAGLVHGGGAGRILRVETAVCFPLLRFSDIRYDFGLARGAPDGRQLLRRALAAPARPRRPGRGDPAVVAASALTLGRDRRIDRAMTARLRLPAARSARSALRCGLRPCCASGHRSAASAAR
jgi:hypothetical protein